MTTFFYKYTLGRINVRDSDTPRITDLRSGMSFSLARSEVSLQDLLAKTFFRKEN